MTEKLLSVTLNPKHSLKVNVFVHNHNMAVLVLSSDFIRFYVVNQEESAMFELTFGL